MSRSLPRRRLAFAVVAAVVAGVLFAGGASASSRHHGHTRHGVKFSVLARLHGRAKASNGLTAGVLAAAFTSGGLESKVYVSEQSGEYCLTVVQTNGPTSQGCGSPRVASSKGLDLVLGSARTPTTVALLLPDGVASATFTDTNGTPHVVGVQNNVVAYSDSNLASASYTMPGGSAQSVAVPPAPTAP